MNYKNYKTVKIARFGTLTPGRAEMHGVGHLTGQQGKQDGPNPHRQAPQIITKITNNYKRKSGPIEQAKRFELQKLQKMPKSNFDALCNFCNSNRLAWSFGPGTRLGYFARNRPLTGQQAERDAPNHGKRAPRIITKITFNYKPKSGPIDQAKRLELQKLQKKSK